MMKKRIITTILSILLFSSFIVMNPIDFVHAEDKEVYISLNDYVLIDGEISFDNLKSQVQNTKTIIKVGTKIVSDDPNDTFSLFVSIDDLNAIQIAAKDAYTLAQSYQVSALEFNTGKDGYWIVDGCISEGADRQLVKISPIYSVHYTSEFGLDDRYYVNGGTLLNDVKEYEVPTDPSDAKRTFFGWDIEGDTFIDFNSQEAICGDMVLNAIYKVKATFINKGYEISYYVDPGHFFYSIPDQAELKDLSSYIGDDGNVYYGTGHYSPSLTDRIYEDTVYEAVYTKIEAPKAIEGLYYNGQEQVLITSGDNDSGFGRWFYRLTSGDNFTTNHEDLKATEAVTYPAVECEFRFKNSNNPLRITLEAGIHKALIPSEFHPTAKQGLSYTAHLYELLDYKGVQDYANEKGTWLFSVNGGNQVKNPMASNAGTYKIAYTYESEGNYSAEGMIEMKIAPYILPIPYLDKTNFVYNGQDQTFKVNTDGLYSNTLYTVSGNVQKNAGVHDVVISLISTNYEFVDSEYLVGRDLVVPFHIQHKPIAIPEADLSEFTYDGSEHTYNIPLSDDYTVTGHKQTNAGKHIVTVTLNDENTMWENGEFGPLTYEFNIDKVAVEAPSKDETVFFYTQEDQTYELAENPLWTITNNVQKETGLHEVYVTLNDLTNYYWADTNMDEEAKPLVFDFIVNRQVVEKPVSQNKDFIYNGQHQIFTLKSNELYEIVDASRKEVGTQVVKVILKDKVNYCWEGFEANYNLDEAVQDLEFDFEIKAKELNVEVSVADKIYDATNKAEITSSKLVGVCNGDDVTLSSVDAIFAQVDVANDIEIQLSDYVISGEDALNYTLVQPKGVKANITTREIKVVGIVALDKTYDGSTKAEFEGEPKLEGVLEADLNRVKLVEGKGAAVFAQDTVDDDIVVKFYGFEIEGDKALNYKLLQADEQKADITAYLVEKPEAGQNEFTYDKTEHTLVIEEDDLYEISNNRAVVGGTHYAKVSLKDNHNYAWDDESHDDLSYEYIILPRGLKVYVTVEDKTYDETTDCTLKEMKFEGILNGDYIEYQYGTLKFDSPEVSEAATATITNLRIVNEHANNYAISEIIMVPATIKAPIPYLLIGGCALGAVLVIGGIYYFMKRRRA